jgi:hypothetical protein
MTPDIQKEIATAEEFENALQFQSPIPIGWAVWKYKALLELIEQLQEREFNHYPITIAELESRIFAQQDLLEQKDAEIEKLREIQQAIVVLTPMQRMSKAMDIIAKKKGSST